MLSIFLQNEYLSQNSNILMTKEYEHLVHKLYILYFQLWCVRVMIILTADAIESSYALQFSKYPSSTKPNLHAYVFSLHSCFYADYLFLSLNSEIKLLYKSLINDQDLTGQRRNL